MWFRRGNGRREESKLSSGHWHKTEHVLGHFTWFNQDNKKQEWSTVNTSELGQHRVLITITQGLTLLSLNALFKSHPASFSHWMFFFLLAFYLAVSGRCGRRGSVEWNLAAWPFHTVRWGRMGPTCHQEFKFWSQCVCQWESIQIIQSILCLSSDQSTPSQAEPTDLSGAAEPGGQEDLWPGHS